MFTIECWFLGVLFIKNHLKRLKEKLKDTLNKESGSENPVGNAGNSNVHELEGIGIQELEGIGIQEAPNNKSPVEAPATKSPVEAPAIKSPVEAPATTSSAVGPAVNPSVESPNVAASTEVVGSSSKLKTNNPPILPESNTQSTFNPSLNDAPKLPESNTQSTFNPSLPKSNSDSFLPDWITDIDIGDFF